MWVCEEIVGLWNAKYSHFETVPPIVLPSTPSIPAYTVYTVYTTAVARVSSAGLHAFLNCISFVCTFNVCVCVCACVRAFPVLCFLSFIVLSEDTFVLCLWPALHKAVAAVCLFVLNSPTCLVSDTSTLKQHWHMETHFFFFEVCIGTWWPAPV